MRKLSQFLVRDLGSPVNHRSHRIKTGGTLVLFLCQFRERHLVGLCLFAVGCVDQLAFSSIRQFVAFFDVVQKRWNTGETLDSMNGALSLRNMTLLRVAAKSSTAS